MPTEVIDLCYVNRSAQVRMALISIELNKYSLRYYSLKYTHKNGQNFWNNLILCFVSKMDGSNTVAFCNSVINLY